MIWKSVVLAGALLLTGKQDMGSSLTGGALGSAPTSPTFLRYTYVSNTGSTYSTSVTTPAMSIGPNELLIAFCGAGQNTAATVPATASYNSASFSIVSAVGSSFGNAAQMNYLFLGASTPVTMSTFTCTPSASSGWQSMVVLEFLSPQAALNTYSNSNDSSGVSSFASGAFTTTAAPTINIFCVNGNVGVVSAGEMAGASSALAGVDQPSLTDSAFAACEWNTSPTSVSSSTGAMTGSNSTSYTAILGAFSY